MIYICSPYSHPDLAVREARFDAVCRHAAYLMGQGLHVFSPIAHTHPIACAGSLPPGFDFWGPYDREYMELCDSAIVLMLPGWQKSAGVAAEIAYFEEAGKPVAYHEPKC